jgi:hypothetical protein
LNSTLKRRLATALLARTLPRLLKDDNPLHRVLGEAMRLQIAETTDDEFRQKLDEFYAGMDLVRIESDLEYDAKRPMLLKPNGYKVNVVRLRGDAPAGSWRQRFTPWGRRFALLAHLGINADLMVLRQGATIPPHGHYRVVSGFYVVEGEIAVRHYDRVEEIGDKVRVRKAFDATLGPRGYTTNSEFHQNIHWLQGLASTSFLFRLNVKGTPTKTFGSPNRQSDRVYVDPTGEPDETGSVVAKYVDESVARQLRIRQAYSCAEL